MTLVFIYYILWLCGLIGMLGEQIELRVDLSSYAVQLYDPHQIEDLIRNWARKLVRSDRNQLPGRFKDAGLGHWIRGRHPWDILSVFPVSAFKQQWLDVQENLQKQSVSLFKSNKMTIKLEKGLVSMTNLKNKRTYGTPVLYDRIKNEFYL